MGTAERAMWRGPPMLLVVMLCWSTCCPPYLVLARQRARSKLALWIDEQQVHALLGNSLGHDIMIPIISDGAVQPLANSMELTERIVIPPNVDTVNLTWQAGPEGRYTYEFDNFTSLDKHLLYQPLLGIPSRGQIPRNPTVFQITIPCKGKRKGPAWLMLGLKIYDPWRRPLKGTPLQFRLKKMCHKFETSSLCKQDCQNGGTCTPHGQCQCRQGFEGQYCQLAMCTPACQNNGTCISPSRCSCPPGFHGLYCEKAICGRTCLNGGRCLAEGFCWCASGFYGDACEYSHCNPPCQNGGTCAGPSECLCSAEFSGDRCEKPDNGERPRRSRGPETTRENMAKPMKRRPRKPNVLDMKVRKAEKRLLKMTYRRSRKWELPKEEKRNLRRLKRKADKKGLGLQERRWLIKLLTRQRRHLNSKDKTKLKRFKNLIRKIKRRQKKPKKRRKFVR